MTLGHVLTAAHGLEPLALLQTDLCLQHTEGKTYEERCPARMSSKLPAAQQSRAFMCTKLDSAQATCEKPSQEHCPLQPFLILTGVQLDSQSL